MDRPAWMPVATVALVASILAASAGGGDHSPAELPSNAVQLPGSHFEKTTTREQKALAIKDLVRATAGAVARRPARSTAVGAGRLAERLGVLAAESVPVLPAPPGHQDPEAGGPCTPARLTPLFDSRPAYQALLELIDSARWRIDLMIFGWDDDDAGRAVAAALVERARAGVLVRLMFDRGGYVLGQGNARVPLGCPTFADALEAEPNIRLIQAPDPGARFDHRKIAVVDGRVAWTGGMILTRPALEEWHNFAFLAEGPIVPQYAALFEGRWGELGGETAPGLPPAGPVEPNAAVRMVRTDVGHRSLKEAVYGSVDSARRRIFIENPYFSDEILIKKLAAARRRGVEVHAVLTLRGDVHVMNQLSTITANRLFRAGARVYLYPRMTHVKAMSVDGTLAYIGTGNFDDLSLRNNREASLTVRGPELIRRIDEGLFLRDIADSQELRSPLPPPRRSLLLEATSIIY